MPLLATARCGLIACVLAVVAGCMTATGAIGDSIADGQTFAMLPGDRVTLSDRSRLQYLGVQSDSRCQPGQQCIWAGNATLAFRWQPAGGNAQAFELSTPQPPQSRALGDLRLTVVSLAFGAAPQVRLRIERGQ